MSAAISGADSGAPACRGACHRAALRADPLAHAGYIPPTSPAGKNCSHSAAHVRFGVDELVGGELVGRGGSIRAHFLVATDRGPVSTLLAGVWFDLWGL